MEAAELRATLRRALLAARDRRLAPATAPATDAPAKHTSNRPDATAEGAEGEGANPAHVAAAGLAAPVVRAIVAGLEPDLRRPLVRALACVLAAGTGDEKVRAVDALDAMPCAASGRAILGAYCVDPDDGEPLPITTAGELVSALAAAEQPPAVHHVNDLPRGCHRVTLADGTTFLPAQPAADPAPRVVRLPLDGDGDEDTAALLRDCAAYASRHCAGDLAVAVCTAMTAPPGDETVDALAFVAADLAREFKHRGREYRASVAALFAAARGLALPSQLRRALRAEGRTVHDVLDDLAVAHGLHATDQLSVRVDDLSLIAGAMARLRASPPATLAGAAVTEATEAMPNRPTVQRRSRLFQ